MAPQHGDDAGAGRRSGLSTGATRAKSRPTTEWPWANFITCHRLSFLIGKKGTTLLIKSVVGGLKEILQENFLEVRLVTVQYMLAIN